jgi:hypothetical protein
MMHTSCNPHYQTIPLLSTTLRDYLQHTEVSRGGRRRPLSRGGRRRPLSREGRRRPLSRGRRRRPLSHEEEGGVPSRGVDLNGEGIPMDPKKVPALLGVAAAAPPSNFEPPLPHPPAAAAAAAGPPCSEMTFRSRFSSAANTQFALSISATRTLNCTSWLVASSCSGSSSASRSSFLRCFSWFTLPWFRVESQRFRVLVSGETASGSEFRL